MDESKDSYHEDRLNEFEICLGELKNININKDMSYTLINYAFKPKNEYLRDSLLIVLYDKDKKMFLNCNKKTEKSIQKSPENVDFKGFSKFAYEERLEQNVC